VARNWHLSGPCQFPRVCEVELAMNVSIFREWPMIAEVQPPTAATGWGSN
jgi:hypothetical protein